MNLRTYEKGHHTLHRKAAPKKKHKMKGKLAAKFGHLNFNPAALKHGAVPPKRKQVVQEIDHSVSLNKPTVTKQGRRKRTKKKIIMVDDESDTVSTSLFSTSTNNQQQQQIQENETKSNSMLLSWNWSLRKNADIVNQTSQFSFH